MKELMQRSDRPALRDTLLWFALFIAFGAGGFYFWGTWWCVPFFLCYGVLYGSSSDSRWHECGHGTAFLPQESHRRKAPTQETPDRPLGRPISPCDRISRALETYGSDAPEPAVQDAPTRPGRGDGRARLRTQSHRSVLAWIRSDGPIRRLESNGPLPLAARRSPWLIRPGGA
jgi:hypothetical protein